MHQPASCSFFFFSILPFFFIIFSIKSSSIYGAHLSDYCNTTRCGSLEVRYPFWRQDIAPRSFPYCGYPGFGIDCSPSEPNPIIHLPSDDFYVKEIDYENSTLLLVDIDVTRNPNCPRAERNLNLEHLSLNYSEQDLNLTFYFNCTSPLPPLPSTYQVDCLSSDGNVSYLSLAGDETQDSAWFGICEEKVVATVMERDGGGMNGWPSRFGRAMNDGFVLHWANARDCAGCEKSNGHCGYNGTDKFMCFCKDGTITNDDCKGMSKLLNLLH